MVKKIEGKQNNKITKKNDKIKVVFKVQYDDKNASERELQEEWGRKGDENVKKNYSKNIMWWGEGK